jgi:hypothetical protein
MVGGLAIGFAHLAKPSAAAQGLPRDARRSDRRSRLQRRPSRRG